MSNSILQGTTPSLKIKIATTDFLVTDVTALELTFQNGSSVIKKSLSDVSVGEDNSFTYSFTEAETLALNPSQPLLYQFRFGFTGGSIVGTQKATLRVADLISEAVMSD